MTLSPLLQVRLPRLHLGRYEEQLELGISSECIWKKKHYLKKLLAISFFEIVLLYSYLEYYQPIQNHEVIQVKHLDQATARAGILMFCLFNIKPPIVS